MLGTNENPATLYPSLTPETTTSTFGENPTAMENPPKTQRQGSVSEEEEIQSKMLLLLLTFPRVSYLGISFSQKRCKNCANGTRKNIIVNSRKLETGLIYICGRMGETFRACWVNECQMKWIVFYSTVSEPRKMFTPRRYNYHFQWVTKFS